MLIACSGIRRNSIAQYLKIYNFFFSDMAAAVIQTKKSDPADLLLYKSMLLLFLFSPAYQFTTYVINQENIVSGSPYIKRKKRSPPAARAWVYYMIMRYPASFILAALVCVLHLNNRL